VKIGAFTFQNRSERIMRRTTNGVIAAFVFASAVLVAAQTPGGNPTAAKMKNPVASSPESIKAGQALFQKNCRFCHNADAKGNGPMAPEGTHPSDLTDAKWDRGGSDGEIFVVIRDGAGPKFDMKGYKSKMTEPDIWNVVNYLRSLQAK
jgi:mono/diheme cytochrome c family protein